MTKLERASIFTGIAVAISLSLGWRGIGEVASAAPAMRDTARIATIDVLTVVERLVSSEKYAKDRDANTTEQNSKLQPIAEALQKIRDDAKDLKEESEKFKQLQADYGRKNQEFQQAQQSAAQQVDQFNTAQITEAYRLVCEAAEKMATESGYSHLFSSKSGPFTIKSSNVAGAVQEILARPIIKGIAADDLTERLLKDMKLDAPPAPAVAKPIDPAAPTAPTTPAASDKK
ncbi:MAG: OmpH family outer membrane protein [Planctomycetes bacterium]|nr:OmpH family outer membrane protein [Planctomycetota bacterium]